MEKKAKKLDKKLRRMQKRINNFHKRARAFMDTHKTEFGLMEQLSADKTLKLPPPDPQHKIQIEALLKEVEDNNFEDIVEGYDALKNSYNFNLQMMAFVEEWKVITKDKLVLLVKKYKFLLKYEKGFLRAAKKGFPHCDNVEELEALVPESRKNVVLYKKELMLTQLQLNSLDASLCN